jgi:hypothetical protein
METTLRRKAALLLLLASTAATVAATARLVPPLLAGQRLIAALDSADSRWTSTEADTPYALLRAVDPFVFKLRSDALFRSLATFVKSHHGPPFSIGYETSYLLARLARYDLALAMRAQAYPELRNVLFHALILAGRPDLVPVEHELLLSVTEAPFQTSRANFAWFGPYGLFSEAPDITFAPDGEITPTDGPAAIVDLGSMDIGQVTLSHAGPVAYPSADVDDLAGPPADAQLAIGHTYALHVRTFELDMIVTFHVVAASPSSIALIWRMLRAYPTASQ